MKSIFNKLVAIMFVLQLPIAKAMDVRGHAAMQFANPNIPGSTVKPLPGVDISDLRDVTDASTWDAVVAAANEMHLWEQQLVLSRESRARAEKVEERFRTRNASVAQPVVPVISSSVAPSSSSSSVSSVAVVAAPVAQTVSENPARATANARKQGRSEPLATSQVSPIIRLDGLPTSSSSSSFALTTASASSSSSAAPVVAAPVVQPVVITSTRKQEERNQLSPSLTRLANQCGSPSSSSVVPASVVTSSSSVAPAAVVPVIDAAVSAPSAAVASVVVAPEDEYAGMPELENAEYSFEPAQSGSMVGLAYVPSVVVPAQDAAVSAPSAAQPLRIQDPKSKARSKIAGEFAKALIPGKKALVVTAGAAAIGAAVYNKDKVKEAAELLVKFGMTAKNKAMPIAEQLYRAAAPYVQSASGLPRQATEYVSAHPRGSAAAVAGTFVVAKTVSVVGDAYVRNMMRPQSEQMTLNKAARAVVNKIVNAVNPMNYELIAHGLSGNYEDQMNLIKAAGGVMAVAGGVVYGVQNGYIQPKAFVAKMQELFAQMTRENAEQLYNVIKTKTVANAPVAKAGIVLMLAQAVERVGLGRVLETQAAQGAYATAQKAVSYVAQNPMQIAQDAAVAAMALPMPAWLLAKSAQQLKQNMRAAIVAKALARPGVDEETRLQRLGRNTKTAAKMTVVAGTIALAPEIKAGAQKAIAGIRTLAQNERVRNVAGVVAQAGSAVAGAVSAHPYAAAGLGVAAATGAAAYGLVRTVNAAANEMTENVQF